MKRIRIGNDFVFVWSIERGGQPENLEQADNVRLVLVSLRNKRELTDYRIIGNVVAIDFTPEILTATGEYTIELHYSLPDSGLTDGERKCAVDTKAFEIVARTAQADDVSEIAHTSETGIGLKGDKGDPFVYEDFTPEQIEGLKVKGDPFEFSDFTPEQIALLQKPASDIATTVSNAEGLRVTAETNRNNAEGLRLSAEIIRNENEADRIEAEGLRAGAETGRQTAEGLRQQAELNRQTNTSTAIFNAEQATDDANDAAILANEKAGLANEKAELANEKAGLAETATTQANDARDGANNAAQSATNLVNTYATDLAAKELKANKQNSLVLDGTGTKFPTVDAVNAKIGAMSGELIVDYTHTSNKEVHISSIDYNTNTFTSVGHGLSNSVSAFTTLMLAINRNELIYPYNVMPFANLTGYLTHEGFWVINATPDTFQLSFTNGGSAITLLDKAETDLTKWHFEYNAASKIDITGLLGKINRGCRAVIDGSFCRFGASYIGCTAYGKKYYKGISGAVQDASFSNWNIGDIPVPSFGGVVVHTDYFTPSGHRKLLDVAIYSYTPTLNRIAFLQRVQNNISPIAIPDADKKTFSIEAGGMITNGTNIKLYTI